MMPWVSAGHSGDVKPCTSMLFTKVEARGCMQEERLEREAEGKRMLLENQPATGGYNSHRNYQNLSARSPDTIEEVCIIATLAKHGLSLAESIVWCR